MILIKWEDLPVDMQTETVKQYYDSLNRKKISLILKRFFDIVMSFIMLTILMPIFLLLALAIKIDSKGPVFYRQVRVTQYGKQFKIHKFRSMLPNADKGLQITVNNDNRITKVGKFIRKYRLDEICQLIDILNGTMTFVGTRPEVPKYVEHYTPEMMATLLLPAGVTSMASVFFKDESKLLDCGGDADEIYITKVLPEKMRYNLKAIQNFSFINDIKILVITLLAVLGKEYGTGNVLTINEKEEMKEGV